MRIPLFDLDGTIFIQGNITHVKGDNYAFEKIYGIKASQSEINGDGMIDKQIVIEVLKLHGLSRKEVEKKYAKQQKIATNYFMKNYKDIDFSLLPGVKDLLIEIRLKGTPIGLLTGNIEEIGWKKLELAGIKDYFDFGAFGNKANKRVELVRIAKQKAEKKFNKNFPLTDFVIVGDTPRDIACAKEAGIKVIAVASGSYNFENLAKYSPDLLVHSLEEKDKIIDFLLN